MSEKEKVEEIVVVTTKNRPIASSKGIRVVDIESDEGQQLAGNEPKDVLPRAYVVLKKVEACKVVKEEGKIFAKCGSEKVDLGSIEPKEIPKQVEEKTEEECPGCAEATAIGWAISYIRPLNDLIANSIYNAVVDEKMTTDEAMDKCLLVAQQHGKTDLVNTIKNLKEMMHKPMAELEKETQ